MARGNGDLEAFTAFLGGLLAAGAAALAMAGVGLAARPTPPLKAAALVTLGAVWLTVTVTLYRRLRLRAARTAQPSKSRAAESS
ncbi:hypothetical protein [Kitasatospora sp. NPDC018619]|uniref:hypothetical protein n=1 Tax=unclassified Kitasatospora TaxID=2633591 RepID=UPI0037A796BE